MTVKELREKLAEFPDDLEVMTKKTELLGTVGNVFGVHLDTYAFFGVDVPCVLIADYSEHNCLTCKYGNLYSDSEPCCNCTEDNDMYEPKENEASK